MNAHIAWVRQWDCTPGLSATLSHYPAGGQQDRHHHDHSQLSFLLAGELAECLDGRDYRPSGIARGNKPAGAPHADQWGPAGVLLFTLRLEDGMAAREPGAGEPGWGPVPNPQLVPRLVRLFIDSKDACGREEAASDLVAASGGEAYGAGDPPLWLARTRQAIEDAPESLLIEDAAREAGVHRVQLSRAFQHFYRLPPSLFRRRVLVARAVAGLVRTEAALSEIAIDAGFADQAHLTRCLRQETGLTPARLRALFR
jgi:AraC family transcriptional regulator